MRAAAEIVLPSLSFVVGSAPNNINRSIINLLLCDFSEAELGRSPSV